MTTCWHCPLLCRGRLLHYCTIAINGTVLAEITFKDCRRVSPPQQMFEVPSHFKVGAYADNSIFNQL